MAYQQKEGDIVVFEVKDKKNPKGPDWTGKALINGVEKQVSLWIKSDTMLAGQIRDKYQSDYSAAKKAVEEAPRTYVDDSDIPF